MKTEKLRLDTIKKVLSRSELKKIMAGSACFAKNCFFPDSCGPGCFCNETTCVGG